MNQFPEQTDAMILNDMFANIFCYPDKIYKKRVADLGSQLKSSNHSIEAWQKFDEFVAKADICEIEELFTATFDMNPGSCLELGWHMYGEAYQRGEFMVHLRRELAACDITESCELPDHLYHILKLLSCKSDDDIVEFVADIVIPSIRKIQIAVEEVNPYRSALDTLYDILDQNYKIEENV